MKLHIIEPTLSSSAGHCFTLVHTLSQANANKHFAHIEVWGNNNLDELMLHHLAVKTHAFFHRKVRRVQLFFLLRRLLLQGDTVFLPTTSRAELAIFALLPKRIKNKGRIFFYIHQMRIEGSKAKRLQAIAKRSSEARILCTTDALAQCMKKAGFQHVCEQPCPFEIPETFPNNPHFHQIIFPGIARKDKNFPFILTLLSELKSSHLSLPFLIQAAPNHHGELPNDIQSIIHQITDLRYSTLRMPCREMNHEEYLEQFAGGICLQPYIVDEYAEKISGITLDALARGCPVIIRKGIHSANLVEQYQAGICIDNTKAEDWIQAIQHIIQHYETYQANCRAAFNDLSYTHHPMRTLETLIE